MRTLYLRIYATLVVVLLLFALVAGWLVARNAEHRRQEFDAEINERVNAWGDLVLNNLPPATSPPQEQADALMVWSNRLGLSMALDDASGRRIASTLGFVDDRDERHPDGDHFDDSVAMRLADGRVLRIMRFGFPPRRRNLDQGRFVDRGASWPSTAASGPADADPGSGPPRRFGDERRGQGPGERRDRFEPPRDGGGPFGRPPGRMRGEFDFGPGPGPGPGFHGPPSPWWFASTGNLVTALALLFIAVAAGAWPVVRRLTRRLEALKLGVEAFGAGALDQRVKVDGSDEVAAVAESFNQAASQVEALVRSHQSLLANASHELRSPLARMKMALSLMDVAPPDQRKQLKNEINTNIAELDSLVEEVLLASRLDASREIERSDAVDLLALAVEESQRVGATAEGRSLAVKGNERLLRRALRNLLENAARYGGGSDIVAVVEADAGRVRLRVCDRGPGVPPELRERIFEPFYRLPGHAEQAGGVGLGLSLVRQIAEHHHGTVHWEARPGGGSCFVMEMKE